MAMKCWSVVRLKKKLNSKKRRFYNEAVSKIEAAFFVKKNSGFIVGELLFY